MYNEENSLSSVYETVNAYITESKKRRSAVGTQNKLASDECLVFILIDFMRSFYWGLRL